MTPTELSFYYIIYMRSKQIKYINKELNRKQQLVDMLYFRIHIINSEIKSQPFRNKKEIC